MPSLTQPSRGDGEGPRDLTPKVSGDCIPLTDLDFSFRLSDEAKEKMAAVDRRRARVLATAHLYWFD